MLPKCCPLHPTRPFLSLVKKENPHRTTHTSQQSGTYSGSQLMSIQTCDASSICLPDTCIHSQKLILLLSNVSSYILTSCTTSVILTADVSKTLNRLSTQTPALPTSPKAT